VTPTEAAPTDEHPVLDSASATVTYRASAL
jgi:hypothetical protein